MTIDHELEEYYGMTMERFSALYECPTVHTHVLDAALMALNSYPARDLMEAMRVSSCIVWC